jgi:putative transposase
LRFAGVPLHIVQRGNNRIACFFTAADYRFYLRHLEELAGRFACAVHAYVLMTNHVHLLLTPSDSDGASLLMKHLAQRYVQYINRVYQRSGTLWEGRFKSSLVQTQGYFLKCQRYIELNPVRAGMVAHPREYPWSSFHANGDLRPSTLIAPHECYAALGDTPEQRTEAYRGLLDSGLDEMDLTEIRSAANGGFALGDRQFSEELARALGRRVGRQRQRHVQRAPQSLSGPSPKRSA